MALTVCSVDFGPGYHSRFRMTEDVTLIWRGGIDVLESVVAGNDTAIECSMRPTCVKDDIFRVILLPGTRVRIVEVVVTPNRIVRKCVVSAVRR